MPSCARDDERAESTRRESLDVLPQFVQQLANDRQVYGDGRRLNPSVLSHPFPELDHHLGIRGVAVAWAR